MAAAFDVSALSLPLYSMSPCSLLVPLTLPINLSYMSAPIAGAPNVIAGKAAASISPVTRPPAFNDVVSSLFMYWFIIERPNVLTPNRVAAFIVD